MRSRGPVPCGAAGAGAQVPRCPLCCLLPAASRSQDSNLGTGQQPPQVITRVAELLGSISPISPISHAAHVWVLWAEKVEYCTN